MPTDNWLQLKELFDELYGSSAGARANRLREIREGDPELATRLEAMLADVDDGDEFLSGIVVSAVEGLDSDRHSRIVGRHFGAYRVTSHLARGGMGDVYVAERDDGAFEQRVAIKLIGRGLIDREAEARFATERRILAKLNHPNIARILDGGTTPEGLAYLVMELVEGEPIDAYCRRHGLSVRQRLELFRAVCAAVEFAHQHLVVHRDIKPSNILVTPEGTPKLLDFGIAKLLGGDDNDAELTQVTSRMLTPDFASPEQVLGRPVTTATDVYALGVLLYVLLTEQRPFSTAGLRPSELERVVVETPPARPSQAVLQHAAGGRARARRLRGDLDNIVMKALRKAPERRYRSADRLSADVRRHLEGRPVSAQGYSWPYVFRKFVQRNLVPVGVGSAVLAAGFAGALYHTKSITGERDRVRAEAEKADATARFLVDIFRLSDSDETAGETITAKEILAIGAERLREDLRDQPETRAMLGTTIGTVYDNLGLYEEARTQLVEAIRLREEIGDLPGLVESLRMLGTVQYELGEVDAAVASQERALAINRELLPADHVDVAANLNDLGHAVYGTGDYDGAIRHYQAAIGMLERLGETAHPVYADTLHDLGQVQQLKGELDAAESNLRKALDYALERYGERHSSTAIFMHDLAVVLHEMDRFEVAEAMYLRVLNLERQLIGEDHPDREAAMTNIGRLYMDMHRLDDAEAYLRQAAEFAARTRGPRHVFTAYDLVNLANLLTVKGETAEAQETFLLALDIYAEALAPDHPYIASASVGYAALLNGIGDARAGRMYAERALEICKASLPPGHWLAASATSVRGESLMLLGDMAAAEPLLIGGYEGVAAARPRDRITSDALRRLVSYYEGLGREDEASRYRERLAISGRAAPAPGGANARATSN